MSKLYYRLNTEQIGKVRWWWEGLQPEIESTARFVAGMARQGRALLSHAKSVEDAMLVSATHVLAAGLFALEQEKDYPQINAERDYQVIGLIAGLLSQVRVDTKSGKSLPQELSDVIQVATSVKSSSSLKELRFRRLMKTEDIDDFYRQMRRLIRLAGGKADVSLLADQILAWYIESRTAYVANPNTRLKTRWAKDYYLAAPVSE